MSTANPLRVLRILATCLGALFAAQAHAQIDWASQSATPFEAALPARYNFVTLYRDLEWVDIKLPPAAIEASYGRYLQRIDDLLLESQPHVAVLPYGGQQRDTSIRVDEAQARKLRGHQARVLSVCTAAEDQLWEDLASAVPNTPDAAATKERLARLQALRRSELLADIGVHQSGVFGTDGHVPFSATRFLRVHIRAGELTLAERQSVLASMMEHTEERTALWLTLLHELGESTSLELAALQKDSPHGPQARGVAWSPGYPKAAAATRMAERAAYLAARETLPPQLRARAVELARQFIGPGYWQFSPFPSQLRVWSVRELARLILRAPDVNEEQRDAARTIFKEWIATNDAWVDKEWLRVFGTWEAGDAGERMTPIPLNEVDKKYLENLQSATGVAWLSSPGAAPPSKDSLGELSAADAVLVGTQRDWNKELPEEQQNESRQARSFMVPSRTPMPAAERNDLVLSLQLTEDQRLVAQSLGADLEATWQSDVIPKTRVVLDLLSGPWGDETPEGQKRRLEKIEQLIKAHPDRRAAWAAARAAEDRYFSGLSNALGKTSPVGADKVCAAQLARRTREATEALALRTSMAAEGLPNHPRLALELRASPSERQDLLRAARSSAEPTRALLNECFELSLALIEINDQNNLLWSKMQMESNQDYENPSPLRAACNAAMRERDELSKKAVETFRAMSQQQTTLMTADLPQETAARYRRALNLIIAMSWRFSDAQGSIAALERTLNALPDGQTSAEAAIRTLNLDLDAWELRTESIAREAARDLSASTGRPQFLDYSKNPATYMMDALGGSYACHVQLLMYTIANQLPAEQVSRVPALARWREPVETPN